MCVYDDTADIPCIPLPKKLKHAIINVQNQEHAYRVSHYQKHEDSINTAGLSYPVKVADMDKL